MKKINIDNLTSHERKNIYKECFDLFVNNEQSYKPAYYINGYEIDRRNFVIFKQAYYEEYANFAERRKYDQMLLRRRNNRYEKVQSRYKEAFEAYINRRDSEDFYNKLATKSMVSVETAKKYPEFYYEKYATDEEKQIYENIREINLEQKKNIKELTVREKLKYMFDVCVNSGFDEEKIEMLTEKYSISPKTVRNYIIKYCEMYASEEELNRYKQVKQKVQETVIEEQEELIENSEVTEINEVPEYVKTFNKIIELNDIKESVTYLLNNNMDITYLKTSLKDFHMSFPNIDTLCIRNTLAYYERYLEYKKNNDVKTKQINKIKESIKQLENKKRQLKIEKQKKMLLKLINIIKDYNMSNYKNYINYCAKKDITKQQFETALKITKKLSKPTYDKYVEKVKLQNQKQHPEKTLEITEMVKNIKQGNFELVNYYESTDMSFEDIFKFSKKILNNEDIEILQDFIDRNKPNPNFNINQLTKKDFVIMNYGEQEEITEEKSKKIIDFLTEKNIPINDKTYLSALRVLKTKNQKKKVA